MNCKDTQQILHGYLDGELDLAGSLGVEQHLRECANCSESYSQLKSLGKQLAGSSLYFRAPLTLKDRVEADLRQLSDRTAPRTQQARPWTWRWGNWLTPLVATALFVFIALPLVSRHSAQNTLADEVLSAHIRSLMVDHKTDVASSDQHTVKPWFDGKLDFAPPVVDPTESGFSLVGGRLDYLHGRTVAALVYQHRKHFINLFVWPKAGDADKVTKTLQGYNLISWTASGMTFWAVSDLNKSELETFTQLIK